jgi:hypothetical protein
MKNKVWFYKDGFGSHIKFSFDDLNFIPRIGEYVDVSVLCDGLGGYVSLVQYTYFDSNVVIHIILKDKK